MSAPKPDPEWYERYPALFGREYTDPSLRAVSKSMCDQYLTVMEHSESPLKDKSRGVRFSQGATRYLRSVARAIERARAGELHSEGMPWPWLDTNCGRGRMPMHGGYVPTEEERRRFTFREAAKRGERQKVVRDAEMYPTAVAVAERGGSPVPTVILAGGHEGNYEFLVVPGYWTAWRLCQYIAKHVTVRECAFCRVTQCGSRGLDDFMIVDAGGTTYLLPSCQSCHWSIYSEAQAMADQGVPVRTDWIAGRSDDWYESVGWPDQKHWSRR